MAAGRARNGGVTAGDANTLLGNLMAYAVDSENVLLPGTWGGGRLVHISYFDPAYYRTFAEYTGVSRCNDVAAMEVWGFNFAPLTAGSGSISVDQIELRR